MNYRVPDFSSTTSVSSEDSFFSITIASHNLEVYHNLSMPEFGQESFDIAMPEASNVDPFAHLSLADKQELLMLLEEKRKLKQKQDIPSPISEPCFPNRVVVLPKWNGKQEDFNFYLDRLKVRVEKEMSSCRESSSICIDIIDTLPEDKKSRVASWFSLSKKADNYDWRQLLNLLQHEFEDTQAQQAALELVQRMEQGAHQYFHEFLKEFEYKVASCGGDELFTPTAMTRQLKASLNNSLRRALIGVNYPL